MTNKRNIFRRAVLGMMAVAVVAMAGCVRVKVDPIQVTMDVNVKVKVDKELDSVFGDLDAKAAKQPAPAKGT